MYMSQDNEKISRRQWLGRVAAVATAGLAVASTVSCRRDAGAATAAMAGDGVILCDGCDRCMPCGYGVDIPGNFRYYNGRLAADGIPDLKADRTTADFRAKAIGYLRGYDRNVPDRHQSQRCVKCFHCVAECPEGVFIVNELAALTALADELRDWECRYL